MVEKPNNLRGSSWKTKNQKNNPIPKAFKAIDLASLKNDEKRSKDRLVTVGSALIHDLELKKMIKATVRNLSPGGICFEVGAIAPRLQKSVMVEFEGPLAKLGLGTVKCIVQWIAPIKSHPTGNQLIGLQFSAEMSEQKKKKFTVHIATLSKDYWN